MHTKPKVDDHNGIGLPESPLDEFPWPPAVDDPFRFRKPGIVHGPDNLRRCGFPSGLPLDIVDEVNRQTQLFAEAPRQVGLAAAGVPDDRDFAHSSSRGRSFLRRTATCLAYCSYPSLRAI